MSVMPATITMTDVQAAIAAGKARRAYISQFEPVKLVDGSIQTFTTAPITFTCSGTSGATSMTVGGSRSQVLKAGSFITVGLRYVQLAADLATGATSASLVEALVEDIPANTACKFEPVIELPRPSAVPTVQRQIQTATENFFGDTPAVTFKTGEQFGAVEFQVGGSRKHPTWQILNRCNGQYGLLAMRYLLIQNASDASWDKVVAMWGGGHEVGGIQEAGKWSWTATPVQSDMVV